MLFNILKSRDTNNLKPLVLTLLVRNQPLLVLNAILKATDDRR